MTKIMPCVAADKGGDFLSAARLWSECHGMYLRVSRVLVFPCSCWRLRCGSVLRERVVCGWLEYSLCLALDTTPFLGLGMVEETYYLLSYRFRQLVRRLARVQQVDAAVVAERQGYHCYWKASIKGSVAVVGSDPGVGSRFLTTIVAGAERWLDQVT